MTGSEAAIPSVSAMALKTCGVLFVVIALLLCVLFFLKRLSGERMLKNGTMEVVGTLPLGPKERVVLVRIRDRELALGVTPNGIRTLDARELPEEERTLEPESPPKFAEFLARAGKGLRNVREDA